MKLFKNEVGRPSNDTLRKRKILIGIFLVAVFVMMYSITFTLTNTSIKLLRGEANNNSGKQLAADKYKTCTKVYYSRTPSGANDASFNEIYNCYDDDFYVKKLNDIGEYHFIGWSKSSFSSTFGTKADYYPGTKYSNPLRNLHFLNTEIKLYGVWERNYTMTQVTRTTTTTQCDGNLKFDTRGGTSIPSQKYSCSDTEVVITTKVPSYKVKVFKGWAVANTDIVTYKPGDRASVSNLKRSNNTLYAVWGTITTTKTTAKTTVKATTTPASVDTPWYTQVLQLFVNAFGNFLDLLNSACVSQSAQDYNKTIKNTTSVVKPNNLITVNSNYVITKYKIVNDMKKMKEYPCDSSSNCYANAYYMRLTGEVPTMYYAYCDRGNYSETQCEESSKYECNKECPNPKLTEGTLMDVYNNIVNQNKPSIIRLNDGKENIYSVVAVGITKDAYEKFNKVPSNNVLLSHIVVIDVKDGKLKVINVDEIDGFKDWKLEKVEY